jgi:hypothetical protein
MCFGRRLKPERGWLPASVSPAYFPEAELEPVLLGDLLGRLRLPLLRLLHGRHREPRPPPRRPEGPRATGEGAALELRRLQRAVGAALRCRRRREAGKQQSRCRHGWADGWGSGIAELVGAERRRGGDTTRPNRGRG